MRRCTVSSSPGLSLGWARASVCLVLPIGADGLARREDARHGGRDKVRSCRRGHRRSVTAGTACLRKRGSRPGGGGATVRAFAREGATWPPSRSRTVAPAPPAEGLAVVPVSVMHSPLDDFTAPACDPGHRCSACRRRALEAVEKIVTAPRASPRAGQDRVGRWHRATVRPAIVLSRLMLYTADSPDA
jgi:hypothetical protein